MPNRPGKTLAGRRAQAARNDEVILEAARAVFLDDPKAPIAAVAERAGVGISALYRRYAGKEDLLRQLCHDGLRRYIAEAEAALAEPDDWTAFTGFLTQVVDADVHSLTVHLAGMFTPTEEMGGTRRGPTSWPPPCSSGPAPAGGCGRTRSCRIWGCCWRRAPRSAYPIRSAPAQLRRRQLAVLLAGLSSGPARTPARPGARGRRVRLAVASPGVMGITR